MQDINRLVESWKEKYANGSIVYNDKKLNEIAVNCASISSVWVGKWDGRSSLEIDTFDSDGEVLNTLFGVNADNLPLLLMGELTTVGGDAVKVSLFSYTFKDGEKNQRELGSIDIV